MAVDSNNVAVFDAAVNIYGCSDGGAVPRGAPDINDWCVGRL
jgi:hypothetical protein